MNCHPQSTDDIALDEMRFGAMSEAKESHGKLADDLMGGREAAAFKDTLILTRAERKFAVAREIARSSEKAYKLQAAAAVVWVSLSLLLVAGMRRFYVMSDGLRRFTNFGIVATSALPFVVLQARLQIDIVFGGSFDPATCV